MSRRKQEKPQPRKNVFRGEADTIDILTCGACRKDFPLADIVRFIQHKVQLCNKENCLFEDSEEDEEDGQDPSVLPVTTVKKEDDDLSSSAILKKAITAKDTSSNTNSTALEPRIYVCSTCKQSLTSAWALILHVQNAHGLSICLDSEKASACSPRAPLLERQPPDLFPRSSSNPSSQQQEQLRLDLIGCKSSTRTPPPLLEPPHLSGCEPMQDFYSQRLRVLAGATSPSAPRHLLQPSFKALLGASTPPENSPEKSQSAALNSSSSSASETTPAAAKAKNRLCEYCGKSFQFKSNLIVHRRSHTGEKPFKCHICNHACTQASKLKRHMKTHRFKNPPSDEVPAHERNGKEEEEHPKSNGKTTNGDGEYGSDEHDDEADDEEIDVEEEEVGSDEELVVDSVEEDDYPRENGEGKLVIDHEDEGMMAEDLTKKPNGVENGKRKGLRDHSLEKKMMKHSIVSEFMENVGLANIPQYSEAFKQALKENTYRNSIKQERCSDGSASNDAYGALLPYLPLERPPRDGTRSAGQSPLNFSAGVLEDLKRRRLDAEEAGHFMYAGVWYPRSSEQHEGSKKSSESAFNDTNGGAPGPSSSALCVALSKQQQQPKDPQRRNDTCEYCGKVFKNCSNLTVHRRSHTGEKPYKCELCSYACAQSSKLTRHMKTHGRLGKDVYRCRFCDMPFSVPSTLEKHMRKCVVSQSGGSPYVMSERDSDSKEMVTFYETP